MEVRQAQLLADQQDPTRISQAQAQAQAQAKSFSQPVRVAPRERQPPSTQILRMPEVCARVGVARSTIYDWLNPSSARHASSFPVPVKLSSGGAIGWYESELDAWLVTRQRAKPV